jgi:epoxyqueuosine reductase
MTRGPDLLTAYHRKEQLRAEAYRLGFGLFGVARPEQPLHFAVYQDWLAAGRHGSMDYLATERAQAMRSDPTGLQAECRSILVVGVRYSGPQSDGSQPGEGSGRVAAYAWGEDYHEALLPRLQALAAFLEEQADEPVACRWYTDTGPILERDLAQRAGLGWIGKNTLLINPQGGSYYLLAEVLTTAELPPDDPFIADRCGSCTRCLQACPTGAILPERVIDARVCISYLTIENKGEIPVELRPRLGEWVFGCDICQQVCPWNHTHQAEPGDPAFAPRPGVPRPELREELRLTPQAFHRKFKGSPVRRTKRRGYLRNVCVAIGNRRDFSAVPELSRVLVEEPEALVRQHAAWALGQIGGPAVALALEATLLRETDETVRGEIRQALAVVQGSQAG